MLIGKTFQQLFKVPSRGFLFFFNKYFSLLLHYISSFLFLEKKEIWIIGGNAGLCYDDNSAAIHKYITKNFPEIKIYYLIKKKSPDIEDANSNGPIIFYNTIKGNLFFLRAKVLIYSHTAYIDIAPFSNKKFFLNKKKIFLRHGITALKRAHVFGSNHDLIISSSSLEKKIIFSNHKEVCHKNIVVTGLPRFDELYKHKENKTLGKILYMPTWRPWMNGVWWKISEKDKESIKNSLFFLEIKKFFTSQELKKFLIKNNLFLEIFFHRNLHPLFENFFENKNTELVKFLPPETNVQKKIIESKTLITDYSSIAWDFLFLNKPVIFFQPDIEEYSRKTGSYIKIPDALPGLVGNNFLQIINHLNFLSRHNFVLKNVKTEKARRKFFSYIDDDNCKRALDEILKIVNG